MLQAIDLQGQVVYGQTDIFLYAGSSRRYVLGRAARAGEPRSFVARQSEGIGSPQEFRPVDERSQAVSALREGQGVSARPRLPRSAALSMPTCLAGRLRTHLQRKDGHAVRTHAQAGEVVHLSRGTCGGTSVAGRLAQVWKSRRLPANVVALAQSGVRGAWQQEAEAAEGHRRDRRDLLSGELQGESGMEARQSSRSARSSSSRGGVGTRLVPGISACADRH